MVDARQHLGDGSVRYYPGRAAASRSTHRAGDSLPGHGVVLRAVSGRISCRAIARKSRLADCWRRLLYLGRGLLRAGQSVSMVPRRLARIRVGRKRQPLLCYSALVAGCLRNLVSPVETASAAEIFASLFNTLDFFEDP